MNRDGDYHDEMATLDLIDDAAAEALLAGRAVPAELESVAMVVQTLRSTTNRPVPPSAELAARMASGEFPGPAERYRAPVHRPQGRGLGAAARAWTRTGVRVLAAVPRKAQAVSLAAKFGTVAAVIVGMVGFGSAGFAGVLPEPVQDRFEGVVETVTRYEFPQRPGRGEENSDFGRKVSEDAKNGGVDGGDVSEDARNQGGRNRPTDGPTRPEPGPGGKPTELPAPGPGENPGNGPADNPGNGPADNPGNGPADNPGNGPPENPGNRPTDPGQGNEHRPTANPGQG